MPPKKAIWDPFTRPVPKLACLTDETVLLQAWKKAHSYLRSKSWYADVLELDRSAVELQEFVTGIKDEINNDRNEAFLPLPMKMVLAPKADSCGWTFKKNRWQPGDQTSKRMRPLAHLGLRDQVLNMAAVIALADIVETVQGDTRLDAIEARKQNVASYGNRLLCEWNVGVSGSSTAEFTWGNAATFRKYFLDYQQFMQRPLDICRFHSPMRGEGIELGVVSLDLKGFYDVIAIEDVLLSLKKLCKSNGHKNDKGFWQAIEQMFSWDWDKTSTVSSDLIGETIPDGLPQGLVASGFYANAYMHCFDQHVLDEIKSRRGKTESGLQILDYCRYVDDLRFVVEGDTAMPQSSVVKEVENWLRPHIETYISTQSCNESKSSYTSLAELESRTMRPTVMAAIQEKLSGPVDVESLEEASNSIDGLLDTITDSTERARDPETAEDSAQSLPPLATIHVVHHLVRDDTVIRFGSYRKLKTLRMLRFYHSAESAGISNNHLRRIDSEMEINARRMIRLWSRDPSLAIVLRHAFNLFPSPTLLSPVIDSLKDTLRIRSGRVSKKKKAAAKEPKYSFEVLVAFYTAAELFKAGVVETGIDVAEEQLPDTADIHEYREILGDLAEYLLLNSKPPWYVIEQAVLFLLSIGRLPEKTNQILGGSDPDYMRLVKLAANTSQPTRKDLPLILVLDQLQGNRKQTIRKLAKLVGSEEGDAVSELAKIWLANPDLCQELFEFTSHRKEYHGVHEKLREAMPEDCGENRYKTRDLKSSETLFAVMRARNNPFYQETAALQLLRILAKKVYDGDLPEDTLHPSGLVLKSKSWDGLKRPSKKKRLSVESNEVSMDDARYELPSWLHGERRKMYSIGRVVRAAMLGVMDYTTSAANTDRMRDGYHGCRTSWYKRQHGMFGGLALSRWEACSCSPWMESLLMHLLRWPGCRSQIDGEFAGVDDIPSLIRHVDDRIEGLRKQYGRASKLPIYDIVATTVNSKASVLSMALVQTVRPTKQDLITHGAELDSGIIRPMHRSHLASLLRLTWEHARLRPSYGKKELLDIVVLPEISVHRDDLDLVERFIDATNAIVFCGLVFYEHDRLKRLVNTGLWILPERTGTGRRFRYLLQGKHNMTKDEKKLGIVPHRPHQYVLHFGLDGGRKPIAISGAICFDATDLKLAADLRNQTDMLIVSAHNQDVPTFDSMANALSWHMFQHVVIVNSGEFGGTVVAAPYRERHERTLVAEHGGMQAAISIIDVDLSDYQKMRQVSPKPLKSPPAGFNRH